MLSPRRRRAVWFAAVALSVFATSGCGRRGDLDPPSASAVQTSSNKHDLDLHRQDRTIVAPKKDFVLDPLLK